MTIAAASAALPFAGTGTFASAVSGAYVPVTSEESAELRKLKAENRELRRANEILKAASVFFAAELDRPQR